MREIDALDKLTALVKTFKSQRDAAAVIGVSQAFLSQMLNEERPIPAKVLTVLGLEKITVARKA